MSCGNAEKCAASLQTHMLVQSTDAYLIWLSQLMEVTSDLQSHADTWPSTPGRPAFHYTLKHMFRKVFFNSPFYIQLE